MLHAGFATDTQLHRGLMSGSEYTFKLVQVCLPEPSKLVVMCDKRKHQCVCLCQVYKSCLEGLLPNYQAFYRVCSKLNKNQSTLLSGHDKQLLVALAGMDVSVPHVAVVSLASRLLKSVLISLALCLWLAMVSGMSQIPSVLYR